MRKNLLHISMSLAFISIVTSNIATPSKNMKVAAIPTTNLSTSVTTNNINSTSISPDTANELKSALDQFYTDSIKTKGSKFYHSSIM